MGIKEVSFTIWEALEAWAKSPEDARRDVVGALLGVAEELAKVQPATEESKGKGMAYTAAAMALAAASPEVFAQVKAAAAEPAGDEH